MDKIDKSLERLKLASEMSLTYYEQPLIITTSGGKDSDICLHLARAAGIPYEVQHNHTTVDAPETVYHVRETMRKLEENGVKCTINMPTYKGFPVTMWSLIPQKLMPPTRLVRYCCSVLKERGGHGRMVTTGVRWAESSKRKKNRATFENINRDPAKRMLLNDNDDARQLFENCKIQAKRICNPIIDWTDNDVWEYIESEKIQTNPLYYEGFSRVGCIGCPIAGCAGRKFEYARYPTYQKAYIKSFDRMIAERKNRGRDCVWQTGIDVFHWWMEDGVLPGQMELERF